MDNLDAVSDAELRTALDTVEEKTPALRILTAIAYKNGTTQQDLADWLGVERKTIYNWLTRIDPDDIAASVRDEPRPGRPRKLTSAQQEQLARALEAKPRDAGLDAERWTATVLRDYVDDEFDVEYSLPSCRRLLAEHDRRAD